MALTMELFTTHGRGANGSNCVCACLCASVCTCAPCCQSEWKGMMESLKHTVTERRGERRGGLKEFWVVLAKVKNHAMLQRGLVLSTGRSDYIYAGTQVLLNTLSSALHPPSLCLYPPLFRPSLSSFPSSPQVPSRYKWLFAVQLPQHVCVCSCLSLTACKTKKMGSFFIHNFQNTKASWIEMSKRS